MMIDFHNDTLLKLDLVGGDFFDGHPQAQIDWPKIRQAGVAGAFFSIWANPAFRGDDATRYALDQIRKARVRLDSPSRGSRIAGPSGDFGDDGDAGFTAFLGIEGGYALNDDPGVAERLAAQCVRKLTLTHFSAPSWATSAADEDGGAGLNALGKRIVRALNRQRIIVDVAHASSRTILDVVEASSDPVVYSHGGVRFLNPTPRCISDAAIKAIASSGGVVGISFFPEHLTSRIQRRPEILSRFWQGFEAIKADGELNEAERVREEAHRILFEYPLPDVIPDAGEVLDNVDYVVRLVGEDHVAIGSDYDGMPYACAGLEDISKIGALTTAMRRKGYPDARIAKILGGNIARVMRKMGRP